MAKDIARKSPGVGDYISFGTVTLSVRDVISRIKRRLSTTTPCYRVKNRTLRSYAEKWKNVSKFTARCKRYISCKTIRYTDKRVNWILFEQTLHVYLFWCRKSMQLIFCRMSEFLFFFSFIARAIQKSHENRQNVRLVSDEIKFFWSYW